MYHQRGSASAVHTRTAATTFNIAATKFTSFQRTRQNRWWRRPRWRRWRWWCSLGKASGSSSSTTQLGGNNSASLLAGTVLHGPPSRVTGKHGKLLTVADISAASVDERTFSRLGQSSTVSEPRWLSVSECDTVSIFPAILYSCLMYIMNLKHIVCTPYTRTHITI